MFAPNDAPVLDALRCTVLLNRFTVVPPVKNNPFNESDEFEFARLLGVPESILNKAPSADLWEGQSDEEELGHSYKEMDDLLKAMIDEKKSKEELINLGFEEEFINKIDYRVKSNAFKGKLPVIANIRWN